MKMEYGTNTVPEFLPYRIGLGLFYSIAVANVPVPLVVQLFDELGQGQFPKSLLYVGKVVETLGLQPQLSGYLDGDVREVKVPLRLEPGLELFRCRLPIQSKTGVELSNWPDAFPE